MVTLTVTPTQLPRRPPQRFLPDARRRSGLRGSNLSLRKTPVLILQTTSWQSMMGMGGPGLFCSGSSVVANERRILSGKDDGVPNGIRGDLQGS